MAKPTSLHAKQAEAKPAEVAPETPPENGAVAPVQPKGALQMPAIFNAPTNPIQARAWAPVITFAHSKRKDEWKKIAAKFSEVEEGEMYFLYKDRIEHLPKAKLAWITGYQFWASKNAAGEIQATSFEEMPHPFKETVQAIVMVYLDDALYPANVQFRTTKCPAARELSDALAQASKPDWGDESAAHAATMVINQPFLRYYGETSLSDPRPGKLSGLPYRPLHAVIKPCTQVEFDLIQAFQDNPDAQKLFDMVAERHTQLEKEHRSKVKK